MSDRAQIIERIKAHHSWLRKDADVRIKRSAAAPSELKVAGDRRELLVTMTTPRIDEDSEVVVPQGGDMGYLGENRSVFYDHQYMDADFIGKIRTGYPKLEGDTWKALIGIRNSPRGDQLVRDAQDFDISVSIGFDAIDAGKPTDEEIEKYGKGKTFRSIVRKWRAFELSVTWMPCNVEARSDDPALPNETQGAEKRRLTLTPFGLVVGG